MAYVELGADNGGILLNLSEGGFAVQSALALTSRDFPALRFQVPHVQEWLTASGKIAWISDSKKEAGIQFTQLPGTSRNEICNWVSAEERSDTAANDIPHEAWDAKGDIFSAPERAALPSSVPPPNDLATRPARRAAPATAPPTRNAPLFSAAQEPKQDFHFTDYSMFAAEAQDDRAEWIKPERKGIGWGGLTLLALLLSALFFALGATIGRGTIEQWIAYATGSPAPRPAPSVTAPPAETADNSAQQSPEPGTSPSAGEQAHSPASGLAGAGASTPSDSSGTAAANVTPSQSDVRKPLEQQDRAETSSGSSTQKPTGSSSKDSLRKGSGLAARPGRGVEGYPQNSPPRSYDDINAGPVSNPNEHAILVNAPAPGSPPFFVNLSSDAVSASSTVAISAQRYILITPRAGSYGRAQRVVIGKLVSHSDPFYPAEARGKRIQGSVVLRVMIGRTGHVIGVIPVRGPNELLNAAIAAIHEWRYEPTYVDGDPAETQAEVTFVFRLP
jgi:TonB family protein